MKSTVNTRWALLGVTEKDSAIPGNDGVIMAVANTLVDVIKTSNHVA